MEYTSERKDRASDRDAAAFFTSLVRCETRLYNALGERLRADHGLATSQFEFLRFLRAHADARVGDLAAAFAIGVGAASKGVDRLEAAGWVARHPHAADGRSSRLALTDAGGRLVAAAEATFGREIARLLAPALTPGEVARVAAALASLQATLEAGRIGVPTG